MNFVKRTTLNINGANDFDLRTISALLREMGLAKLAAKTISGNFYSMLPGEIAMLLAANAFIEKETPMTHCWKDIAFIFDIKMPSPDIVDEFSRMEDTIIPHIDALRDYSMHHYEWGKSFTHRDSSHYSEMEPYELRKYQRPSDEAIALDREMISIRQRIRFTRAALIDTADALYAKYGM